MSVFDHYFSKYIVPSPNCSFRHVDDSDRGIPRHTIAVLIKKVDWDWVERTPSGYQPPRSYICNVNSNTVALWPLVGQPLGRGKGELALLISQKKSHRNPNSILIQRFNAMRS